MPSLLSRFKRSPSRSSDNSFDEFHSQSEKARQRRESTASSSILVPSTETEEEDFPRSTTTTSHSSYSQNPASPNTNLNRSGSVFIEGVPNSSPSKHQSDLSFSSGRKNVPSPLVVPSSGLKPTLGTPKLVLTEEGSNSPHSFTDSPGPGTSPTPGPSDLSALGLGLGETISRRSSNTGERNLETPTFNSPQRGSSTHRHTAQMNGPPTASTDVYLSEDTRPRSGSILSSGGLRSRSGSIVDRLSHKHHSPVIPSAGLKSSDDSRKKKKGKKGKKERTRSVSSAVSGANSSIAAALAKSGLQIASPVDADISSAQSTSKRNSRRSPYLVRGPQTDDDSYMRAEGDDEASRLDIHDFEDDEDDEEDESDSDLEDHLPVTGFAVASNRRQHEFHAMFPAVDEGDYLIEDYGCALSKDILVQGRLYVSENHLCFHANIFGWVTDLVIPFTEIRTIEKKMTALVIPNAIGVQTRDAKYTFASFLSRDSTFDVMMNIWRLCNPNAVMSITSFVPTNGSRPPSMLDEPPDTAATVPSTQKSPNKGGHAKTECACGRDGKHYAETAMDAIFHSTPEKTYNLMFNSEWYKKFLSENQKLRDVEMSDWHVSPETKNLIRSLSYIKPLNGSIGPKQTKCHITDEHQHRDFDTYISMLTTTKTPDVPSGGVFSVKTRSCITWAGPNSTRVLVTTAVEWTGKSWVKGIIEKSAIEGQKSYHEDLEKGMKAYMKEHSVEFAGHDGDMDDVEDVKTVSVEEKKPTEAAAYAAQQRKERQERDYWSMQGGLDRILSGLGSIAMGLKAVFDALTNIISDIPLSKETLLAVIILILVISNIYTYFAFKTTKESVRARRARKLGDGYDAISAENDMEEVLRKILRERSRTPKEEAQDLERMLDGVEERVNKLRSAVRTIRVENGEARRDGQTGLDDLD